MIGIMNADDFLKPFRPTMTRKKRRQLKEKIRKRVVSFLSVLALMFAMAGSAFVWETTTITEILGLDLIATVGPITYTGNATVYSGEGTSGKAYNNCAVIATVYFKIGWEAIPRSPVVNVQFQKQQPNKTWSTLGGAAFSIDVPNNITNIIGGTERSPSASGSAYFGWSSGDFAAGTYRFRFAMSGATTAFAAESYGFTSHNVGDGW